jgi:xylulokinase
MFEKLGAAGVSMDDIYQSTTNFMPSGQTSLMEKLKEDDPETFAKVSQWCDCQHGLVSQALGGEYCCHESYGMKSGMYNVFERAFDEKICAAYGIDPSQLAELRYSGEPCGVVSGEVAAQTGLKAGTPIFVGINDAVTHIHAQGALGLDEVTAILGTWGIMCKRVTQPYWDPTKQFSAFGGGGRDDWALELIIAGCGATLRWLRENVLTHLEAEAAARGIDTFDVINEHAAKSPVGANGVFANPQVMGDLHNQNMKATLVNLNPACNLDDMIRAVYEGIAYELKKGLANLESATGVPTRVLHVSGGGAKSPVLLQILADVTGMPLHQAGIGPDLAGAKGAAMIAGIGAGIYADIPDAVAKTVRQAAVVEPISENVASYAALFEKYQSVFEALGSGVYAQPLG